MYGRYYSGKIGKTTEKVKMKGLSKKKSINNWCELNSLYLTEKLSL